MAGGWFRNDDEDDEPIGSGSAQDARGGVLQARYLHRLVWEATTNLNSFRIHRQTVQQLHGYAMGVTSEPASAFRSGPCEILGSRHKPPPASEVERLVDEMLDRLNEPRAPIEAATAAAAGEIEVARALDAAAYALWRLNWIHPFEDGNGRTARALAYLVLCWQLGFELPGRPFPELVLDHKRAFYNCLADADLAWRSGRLGLTNLHQFIERMLRAQLKSKVNP